MVEDGMFLAMNRFISKGFGERDLARARLSQGARLIMLLKGPEREDHILYSSPGLSVEKGLYGLDGIRPLESTPRQAHRRARISAIELGTFESVLVE